jgi:NAD-dependent deacetylase
MNKLLILSGSGISQESGLQTYHDTGGIWHKYNVDQVLVAGKQHTVDSINFLNEMRALYKNSEPNLIHKTFAKIKQSYGDRVLMYTQNVDNLLEKANCPTVLHLHGQLAELKCESCNDIINIGYNLYNYQKCPKCDLPYRTNIVMFGEPGYYYKSLAYDISELTKDDIVIVIGTSCSVIDIDTMISDKHCTKILCNKEKHDNINETQYDYVFYGNGTSNIDEINTIVNTLLK